MRGNVLPVWNIPALAATPEFYHHPPLTQGLSERNTIMEIIGNAFNWVTKTKLRSFIFGMAVLTLCTTVYRLYAGISLWG